MPRPLLLVAALALLPAAPAHAHGLEAGRAEGMLRDATLRLSLAPAAAAFRAHDADGDGRLAAAEVQASREVLRAELAASLHVVDDRGRAPADVFFDVGVPDVRLPDDAAYVRFTVDLRWPDPPAALTVTSPWPLWLEVVRATAVEPGRWRAVGAAASVRLAPGVTSPPLLAAAAATTPATTAPAAAPAAAPASSSSGRLAPALAGLLAVAALAWSLVGVAARRAPSHPGVPR